MVGSGSSLPLRPLTCMFAMGKLTSPWTCSGGSNHTSSGQLAQDQLGKPSPVLRLQWDDTGLQNKVWRKPNR
jgi:hypothetical protein